MMECEEVLDSFISKYRSRQRSNDLTRENQQLDEIICKIQPTFFVKAKSSLAIESLVYLFELANANPTCSYNSSALALLHITFSKRCYGIYIKPKYLMSFTLNTVSCIIDNYGDEEHSFLEKRLDILKYVTYGIQIHAMDEKLKDFLEILLSFLKTAYSQQLLKQVLAILQNLARNSPAVKNYISSRNDPNEIYVAFLQLLNTSRDSLVRVLAMSIYTNIDTEGAKDLASSNSTGHTFELIFSIIAENNEDCTTYAVDLLVDLLSRVDFTFKNQFLSFKYMNNYINKLVELLPKISSLDSAAKIYELVLTLHSIDGLSSTILEIIFDKQNFQSDQPCPLTLASKWFSEELKSSEMIVSYPAVFLACILQNATNYISLKDCQFTRQVDDLTDEIMTHLQKCHENFSMLTSRGFQKTGFILEVLSNKVKNRCDMKANLRRVLEDHLRICAENNNYHLINDNDFCDLVQVVIQLLIFMHKVKERVDNLQDVFYQFLQDGRLMQVFAKALSMESKSNILNTLSLINIGMKLSNFPHLKLGEAMSFLNATKRKVIADNNDSLPSSSVPSRCSLSQNDHNIEESVDQLIYRFKKDLELKHLKPSQIMDIYERKIQMLESKYILSEQLLATKTKSLQQAENIISQYRYRWAPDEGIENLHLRNIVHEVERRNEALTVEATEIKAEVATLKSRYKEAMYDLELLTSHREKLLNTNDELTLKCRKVENNVKTLSEEIATMESRNATLESKNKASEVQIEELTKRINLLNEEKLKMKQECKDKSNKYNELKKTYNQLDQRYEVAETNNKILTTENNKFESEIQTLNLELEQEKKELQELKVLYDEKSQEYASLADFMANVGKMIDVRKESNTGLTETSIRSSHSRK